MTSEILIGVIIGVLTSATQSIGLTLQRKSHLLSCPRSGRIVFRLGLLLFIASNLIGSAIQIKTLPLIILSPLQSIGLVFNSIFASLILNEAFTRINLVGTVLILIGALFIGYFNNLSEDSHLSNDKLFELLTRPAFLKWFCFVNVFVLSAVALITLFRKNHSNSQHYIMRNFHCIRSVLFGCYSGVLSSNSLLFAKVSLDLALNVIKTPKMLIDIRILSTVALFVSMAVLQLVFLNKGLKHISTSILYPLIFCVYNFVNIVNDLVFFDQTANTTQLTYIIIGTLFVLAGVYLLSYTHDLTVRKDEEETECQYGATSCASGNSDSNSDEDEEAMTHYSHLLPKRNDSKFSKRDISFGQMELLSQLELLKSSE
ncbi:hypothetical protein WICPIJ_002285 [Wickerhamomyces pijperi]|uniref:Magnesium transporter n=1 Tax=Wickerhamomyces pijperi TaxID=599730 RepID=A0A9P8QC06_WICPI|nr:hypothetical protein WICPIJ_002285 [Wickerhamomyces pijperi]